MEIAEATPAPSKTNTIATGLAMFSMMFGAGNIVFALAIGQYAQDNNLFAILGLLLTAVGVPFLGLIAMTLFGGDYKKFFGRIGTIPGFLVSATIMGLIGPFGAIPRCIALSYSTAQMYLPSISLPLFSLAACAFIFLFTIRRTSILDLVGYVLTPLKLGSLLFIIVKGFFSSPAMPVSSHTELTVFLRGLTDGYQTMDLLGAFFFCSVVLDCLKKNLDVTDPKNYKTMLGVALRASCIGASLLAAIYVGFSYVAAMQSSNLTGVAPAELISQVAVQVLGPYAGILVCFTVTIACLTTAIALTTVFAEFVHKDLTLNRVSYPVALVTSLAITFGISTLHFTGIMALLAPVLQLVYPALIVLCIVNIAYKLKHYQPIKWPFFTTFALSVVGYFLVF